MKRTLQHSDLNHLKERETSLQDFLQKAEGQSTGN